MIETIQFYMSYPFVRYALIVGVLIALCSSLFGVSLVLKRFSFIGDGLSHVAFGAMAVASVFQLASNTILVMPVTIIAAHRSEHKTQGRLCHCNDVRGRSGNRLFDHECIFHISKCIR